VLEPVDMSLRCELLVNFVPVVPAAFVQAICDADSNPCWIQLWFFQMLPSLLGQLQTKNVFHDLIMIGCPSSHRCRHCHFCIFAVVIVVAIVVLSCL
jgi:hypothetical protein